MSGKKRLICGVLYGFLGTLGSAGMAIAEGNIAPVATDSRIKTFVYSENEVYRLVLHYGYQAHIQLDKKEQIQAISVGDSYAWKVTPIDYRIFVKPLEESAHTNLTIITDRRTYQFDLQSKEPGDSIEDDLVYQVRFYYPIGNFDMPHLAQQSSGSPMVGINGGGMMSPQAMQGMMAPADAMEEGMMPPSPAMMSPMPASVRQGGEMSMPKVPPMLPAQARGEPGRAYKDQYNFDYTLTGPDSIAPSRIFDDGRRTYFEFPDNNARVPYIATVQDGDNEIALNHYLVGNFVAVDAIGKKFSLRLGQDTVFVYNESANRTNGGQ